MTGITKDDRVPLPERRRRGHVPVPGDVYITEGCGGTSLHLVASHADGKTVLRELDPETGQPCGSPETVTDGDLQKYFRLSLLTAEELVRAAREMDEGSDPPENAGLPAAGKDARQLTSDLETLESLKDAAETKLSAYRALADRRRAEMEAKLAAYSLALEPLRDQIENLGKIIKALNLYTGKTVSLEQTASGDPAPDDTPLSLRQRILFMDEEMLIRLDSGGADWRDTGRFGAMLSDPAFRDIIVPEPRCVTAVKPRRYSKVHGGQYSPTEDEWNRHTWFVFRNGGNVWMSESSDFECRNTAFPRREQLQELLEKAASKKDSRSSNDIKRESDAIVNRTRQYAMYIQGIVDNAGVFVFSDRPNIMSGHNIRFIYDAEDAIGTGADWHSFRAKKNESIRRGTRVFFLPGEARRLGPSLMEYDSGTPGRFYASAWSYPRQPAAGVYSVDEIDSRGRGSFVYLPPDPTAFLDEERRRRERWIYENDHVINYDAVTSAEIDALLSDRTIRRGYLSYMRLLTELRNERRKEEDGERLFIDLMTRELGDSEETRKTIAEAVEWWKSKVIFTRPLKSDDAKAWRMIKKFCQKK